MKILLDENTPKQLKKEFGREHQVFTVRDLDWSGIKNGALLGLMVSRGIQVLVTLDRSIPYQQNLDKFPVLILVLHAHSNHIREVKPFMPQISTLLERPFSSGVERLVLDS